VFNFRDRAIRWLVLSLNQIINLSELINSILVVGLDNKHASLNKALPMLTGAMKRSRQFKNIDSFIELVVIDVEFN
jgi:hypothetical protein